MKNTAAAYARFSTDRQDARSIDDQLRRCRAFAESHGLTVAAEFKDAAVSGAHTDRADLQRLLLAARAKGGSPFGTVIVDDLSRLSRDLGNTWRIVFEDLASAQVKVIDATTGMASDGAGARLTFGAMALVNDTFLQLVKTETHRGLEGRALAGFSTGGRVYGYSTEKEESPPDPEHPRSTIRVNDAEAEVVRRIFAAYVEGQGLASIAEALNRDGIAAPYDKTGVPKTRGRGWGQSTIRAMLLNERYRGVFVWNRRKFVRVPGKRTRKAVERPKSEWRTVERPELAIIDAATWAKTQERFKSQRALFATRGPRFGGGNTPHLLSGIARCSCGAGFGVTAKRTKNGVTYTTMGCAAHATRGDAICANGLTISERKLNAGIIGALRDKVEQPGLVKRLVDGVRAYVASHRGQTDGEAARLEKAMGEATAAVRNLTDAVARIGWSDALQARLQEEEGRLAELKRAREALQNVPSGGRLPSVAAVEGYLRNLLETLTADVERARELLRRHLGTVTLTPQEEGGRRRYIARGEFDISLALYPENSTTPFLSEEGRRYAFSDFAGARSMTHRVPVTIPIEVVFEVDHAA